MDKINSEYLAPQVKVVKFQMRQMVLTGSPTNVGNPFDNGAEQSW